MCVCVKAWKASRGEGKKQLGSLEKGMKDAELGGAELGRKGEAVGERGRAWKG